MIIQDFLNKHVLHLLVLVLVLFAEFINRWFQNGFAYCEDKNPGWRATLLAGARRKTGEILRSLSDQ